MTRVMCIKYSRKDTVVGGVLEEERKEILYPKCGTEKKKLW